MSTTNVAIADRVRGVAAEKRLNQQYVANILGLSRTSVAERFSGRVPFTASEIYTLSNVLGVRIERFYPTTPVDSPLTRESAGAFVAPERKAG